jgi:hypothetical protein
MLLIIGALGTFASVACLTPTVMSDEYKTPDLKNCFEAELVACAGDEIKEIINTISAMKMFRL